MAFYMKDLSIQGFWNLFGVVLGPSPVEIETNSIVQFVLCHSLTAAQTDSESTSLASLT